MFLCLGSKSKNSEMEIKSYNIDPAIFFSFVFFVARIWVLNIRQILYNYIINTYCKNLKQKSHEKEWWIKHRLINDFDISQILHGSKMYLLTNSLVFSTILLCNLPFRSSVKCYRVIPNHITRFSERDLWLAENLTFDMSPCCQRSVRFYDTCDIIYFAPVH